MIVRHRGFTLFNQQRFPSGTAIGQGNLGPARPASFSTKINQKSPNWYFARIANKAKTGTVKLV
jgi:hypothetical protein